MLFHGRRRLAARHRASPVVFLLVDVGIPFTWLVLYNYKLGVGQYLRSMPLMILLPVASIRVLFISIACIIVMFVLICHAVVAVGMPL